MTNDINKVKNIITERFILKEAHGSSDENIETTIYEFADDQGDWYRSECSRLGVCTPPERISQRMGLQMIPRDNIKLDLKDAIHKFRGGNWGSEFVEEISLSWPLTPDAKEPYYSFHSNLDIHVKVGAFTGETHAE